jgi:hypothetical protein
MTDYVYTHELLREDEWTTDGRLIVGGTLSWWEQIPLMYEGAILGAIGNIRREGNRIYGDTDTEIPEDAVITCDVDHVATSYEPDDRMRISGARLIGAHVSEKGTYPWKDDEEEGGEADASRRDQQVVDPDDPRRVEDR